MFETLKAMPPDSILTLIEGYQNDSRDNKIDLGVGVYRDQSGQTPILETVKKAEQYLVDQQSTKTYLGSHGNAEFNEVIQALTFGEDARTNKRITTLQTPGGSGALRIAAGLITRVISGVAIWTSDPTWANHIPLLGSAGIKLKSYPYYDLDQNDLCFDSMLETLNNVPSGDIILLHGCCHNPSGMDLSKDQWHVVTDLIVERELLPFIDIAYQGFASDLEEDAYPVRLMFENVPEMIVASSCSKNFGLYRDRLGALSIVAKDSAASVVLRSQVLNIVRTLYSMPPDHGGAVVSYILNNTDLRHQWLIELNTMRKRLKKMRTLLGVALREEAPDYNFSHIERTNGMFCFLGITPLQVDQLKSEFGIYMVNSSRINIAGITEDNVEYLATSITAVL